MAKGKVLELLCTDKFSGAENVAISIIENLSNDYDFVYVSKDGQIKTILEEKGIKHNLPENINLKTVKKIIAEEKPDIIHAHDYTASTYAALSGFKGKIISHIHSDAPFAKKWNKYMIAFSLAIKNIDTFIFVSSDIPKNVIYKNKIKNKTEVVLNTVDERMVKNLANKRIEDKFDIAYFGRLEKEKNPLEFIEIINTISKTRPNTRAVVIGNGSLEKMCKDRANDLDIKDNIVFKGFLKNPFPYINASTCVIMPSKYEGLSIAAVECLILRKPVFNNGVSGFNDIYDGNNKYLCKDAKEYAEKISAYLDNPNKPNVNLNKFTDIEKYYRKIKEIYES